MTRLLTTPAAAPFRTFHPQLAAVATALALLAGAWLGGCQAPRTSDRDVAWIGPPEAKLAMQGERRGWGGRTSSAVVDVRSASEFEEGRIPGAVHLPLETAREEHGRLRGNDTIIVYGRDRGSPRAIALSKLLMELGYRDVRTLQGGFHAWREAGYAVEGR